MSLGLGLADGRVYHENAQSLDLRRFSKLCSREQHGVSAGSSYNRWNKDFVIASARFCGGNNDLVSHSNTRFLIVLVGQT